MAVHFVSYTARTHNRSAHNRRLSWLCWILESMSVKPIDTFITNSVQLFEVNPSQTILSISYKWKPQSSKKKPVVSFKTHNAHLSSCYKFKTNKSKDVSRLLSALGPRGVTITRGKIEKRVCKPASRENGKKSKKEAKSRDVVGLSTLIVNTEVKEHVPVVEQKEQSLESSKKKNKNKNKGKKRR
ncbi:hypothetical protein HG536_0A03800 [Torulaspora globosa]|uniref:SRP9 domain-containing protein n=1 Tax=Torulaspora globosa TaxID=48254 RepID=A0A7G3ZAM6_9SACH|nr:uncharacterized protein HG536_0A03800 [Torulaspora globosa]QLL30562.1 hypothetical protein HG536_0A03800 [Torulaspora globosa]